MSKEIHFLEDGYYVDKLEKENKQLKEVLAIKENQLVEVRNNKTDYTQVNILEMKLDKYKEAIDEIREYIKENRLFQFKYDDKYSFLGISDEEPRKELLQILDKVKEN